LDRRTDAPPGILAAHGFFAAHGFCAIGFLAAHGFCVCCVLGFFAAHGLACCATAGIVAATVNAPTIVIVAILLIEITSLRYQNPTCFESIPPVVPREIGEVTYARLTERDRRVAPE
jgi:hypothetical protein